MAKFRFDLEAVLTQRRAAERAQQVAVSLIEREKIELEGLMRAWNETLAEERRDLRDRLGASGSGVLRLARFQAVAALHLTTRLRQASGRLAGIYARLERARAELAALAAKRQAVEKLKEQRLAEWKSERAKREWVDQDDMAVCGFGSVDGVVTGMEQI